MVLSIQSSSVIKPVIPIVIDTLPGMLYWEEICIDIRSKSKSNEPRCEKTGLRGFRPGSTRFATNRAVQPHKMARGLKFRI